MLRLILHSAYHGLKQYWFCQRLGGVECFSDRKYFADFRLQRNWFDLIAKYFRVFGSETGHLRSLFLSVRLNEMLFSIFTALEKSRIVNQVLINSTVLRWNSNCVQIFLVNKPWLAQKFGIQQSRINMSQVCEKKFEPNGKETLKSLSWHTDYEKREIFYTI